MTDDAPHQSAFYDQRWATANISNAKRQRGEAITKVVAREARRSLNILELGCGTGWLSNELARYGTCLGVDISPLAIQQASEVFSKPRFAVADLADYRPAADYDVVVSHEVLEHVRDQTNHVRIAFEALKPGGVVILTTPNAFAAHHAVAPIRHQYEPQPIENWLYLDEVKALLELVGFSIETLTTIVPSRSYRNRAIRLLASERLDSIAVRLGGSRAWSGMKGRIGLNDAIFAVGRR